MLDTLRSHLFSSGDVTQIIISISLMLFLGFSMTRITKRLRLPNVTAYIVCGILMGPYCLNLIPARIITGMDFISDIALAFIAFSVGEFFRLSALRKNGVKVILITVLEACMASVLVFILTYWVLRLNLAFSIVLAALASATAPASTMMTIRQLGAKGDFVDTLLQVVALDDVVSLLAYSISISVAMASLGLTQSSSAFDTLVRPLLINLGVIAVGCLFGLFLKFLFRQSTTDNRLIVSIAMLFAFCGICAVVDVSPLLGCMSMGMVYINVTDDDKLFKQLNYFSPPILLLFFVHSGQSFNLASLVSATNSSGSVPLLTVGIAYFLVRILGKYVGAWLGCWMVRKPSLTRNYLGLALIPQAGVSIGLAALAARTLGGSAGSDLQTIILASSVLYELIGPACAKLALFLSRSYSTRIEDLVEAEPAAPDAPPKSEVELLIERIHKIQKSLPEHSVDRLSEEEAAFLQAAQEQSQYMDPRPRRGLLRRL